MNAKNNASVAAEDRIYNVVRNRIITARPAIKQIFSSALEIRSKIWIVEDIAYLLIDGGKAISRADKIIRAGNIPFPGLVSKSRSNIIYHMKKNMKYSYNNLTFDISNGCVFGLDFDAGVIVSRVIIIHNDIKYKIEGTLLALRFGDIFSEENYDEWFEDRIAHRSEYFKW